MFSDKRIPPPSFSKYFKTTTAGQKLMDSDGRLCELDRSSHKRELVCSKYPGDAAWDEMQWSQAKLYDRARQDPTLRISRKKPDGMKTFEILQCDFFNEPERSKYADKPHMNASVACVELGFMQARREWIYILSRKPQSSSTVQAPLQSPYDCQGLVLEGLDHIEPERRRGNEQISTSP